MAGLYVYGVTRAGAGHAPEASGVGDSPVQTSRSPAIYELEKGRLRTVFSDAVWAAYRRTLELGERLERETDA